MPKFRDLLPISLALLLFGGCQTPDYRAARLQTGMSRAEIIALLGPPKSAVHNGSLEVLHFDLTQRDNVSGQSTSDRYYVIFGRDRRVESFGPN